MLIKVKNVVPPYIKKRFLFIRVIDTKRLIKIYPVPWIVTPNLEKLKEIIK